MSFTHKPLFLLQIVLPAMLLFLLSGCNTNKHLQAHRQEIRRLSDSNITPEAKLDGLATTLTQVLDESLQYINPKESYEYAESFYQQNQKELDKLLEELGSWITGMNTIEKIALGVRVATQPYTSDMIDLVPRFQRKVGNTYKSWSFLNRSLGLFKLEDLLDSGN